MKEDAQDESKTPNVIASAHITNNSGERKLMKVLSADSTIKENEEGPMKKKEKWMTTMLYSTAMYKETSIDK